MAAVLSPSLRERLKAEARKRGIVLTSQGIQEARGPKAWLAEKFPHVASAPLSERHERLWEWFESLRPDTTRNPRVEVWPRGGAKSSTGELGVAYVASRLSKRFVLIVCGTQDRADEHVQTISGHLERLGYSPLLNKQGNSKGWRRNQLRTAHGFNVAALGLDTAVRGIKLDEFRPDLIVFDDVDSREDTPEKTSKKERSITQGILPAGSSFADVLFLQNLILEDGMVDRMVTGRADYLLNAEIRGPEPAILGLEVVDDRLENGRGYKRIVAGVATWAGQSLETCQRQIIEWGWTAFKRESQHEVYGADGYFFDAARLTVVQEVPRLLRLAYFWDFAGTEGGGDYTAGVLMGIAPNGNLYVLRVVRDQMGSERVRKTVMAEARWARATYPALPLTIGVPNDPGSAGTAISEQYVAALNKEGFAAYSQPVTGSKADRAKGLAGDVNDGNVYLLRGDWNHAYRDELRKFREDEKHDYDDQVDPCADCQRFLRPAKTGGRQISLAY